MIELLSQKVFFGGVGKHYWYYRSSFGINQERMDKQNSTNLDTRKGNIAAEVKMNSILYTGANQN